MGARGPKPLPSGIKQMRGTYRRDRAARNEARPLGKPKPPAWLKQNPEALKEFKRLVRELSAMGLVGSLDANALTRYTVLWVRWRQAEEMVKKGGDTFVIKGDDGKVKTIMPAPHVAIARQLSEQLARIEGEFGMTPSSRSRIEVAPPAARTEDPKGRFFDAPLRMAE